MSKWRCVSRPDKESENFTVGKVYKLDDNTDELTGDSGYRYGQGHLHNGCGGTIAFLRSCMIKFEEVKDMFSRDDLETGMVVETKNGVAWIVFRNSIYSDMLLRLSNDNSTRRRISFTELKENLEHKLYDELSIVKVVKPDMFPGIFEPETDLKSGNIVYRREEPKELTVGQIEEILGYKIKVVADKESD